MTILLIVAFVSGLVTILAPCIWPLLPIILSTTTTGGKKKALGITLGICGSFLVFTLTISYLVSALKFDPNILRLFAVVVIGFLGLSLVVPWISSRLEVAVSRLSNRLGGVVSGARSSGFWGGLLTGSALGIVWTPCAGPILATIATLAATRAVNLGIVLVTVVYVVGIGIPLFLFALAGSTLFTKSRFLNKYTGRVQQVFGMVMIVVAILIFTNYDKVLQAKLLDAFPSYTNFLIKLENSGGAREQLKKIKGGEGKSDMEGKPFEMPLVDKGSKLPVIFRAGDFVGITRWLNTDKALTIGELKGKVVLVDFWTYTCINCIRTLPYVTSWWEKYKDQGLVVIGVHTPEFEFEKKTENVQAAISQYKITYPVAQDNEYKTWEAFNNRYWPAKYLIDAEGNVRYVHFGEGKYEETETAIKQLLEEAGSAVEQGLVSTKADTPMRGATPETYLGFARLERFGSAEGPKLGVQKYSIKYNLPTDYFGYQGTWDMQSEFSRSESGSELDLNFKAGKVFLVMSPKVTGEKVGVYLDGKPIDPAAAGEDVKAGQITVDGERLYKIVDLRGEDGVHILELKFIDGGTAVFAFTFG